MIILGIETSCDETAAAVVSCSKKETKVLSQVVYSQIKEHTSFGGVVPEVAARIHSVKIMPVIESCLKKADIKPQDISAIAVTSGPGLSTSLLIGIQTAQTLSFIWKKPIIPTNHILGHIVSPFLNKEYELKDITFPALALIISGGHTQLIKINSWSSYELIGQTRDDAVGESYDKVAKLLALGYPGGPHVSQHAQLAKSEIPFPRPMYNSPDYDFSFSGLKTAVRNEVQKQKITKPRINTICKGFENAVTDVITHKTQKALKDLNIKSLILGGGVAANTTLRTSLTTLTKDLGINFFIPEKKYCTDNAAMIALAGYIQKENKQDHTQEIQPQPQWKVYDKRT